MLINIQKNSEKFTEGKPGYCQLLKQLQIKVLRTNQYGGHDTAKTISLFHTDSLRHFEFPQSNQIALF